MLEVYAEDVCHMSLFWWQCVLALYDHMDYTSINV
jgi:hypothetical protein